MPWVLCLCLALALVAAPATLQGSSDVTREEAIQVAKELLAEEAGLEAGDIRVRRAESVQWPDRGLGCPRDGQVYAAVVTPGYRVWLQVARTLYTVHVGGGRGVVCGEPVGPPGGGAARFRGPERVAEDRETAVTGEAPEEILDAVRDDLAERTGASRASFEIVRAEETVWSDGSLGCPQPGVEYLQAPVRGYHVILRHGDRDWDYRAVRAGFFILCERPWVGRPPPPAPRTERQD